MTDAEWPVTKNLFQICFPFHIIFDTSLTICHMGVSMSRLLPDAIARDKITDHFDLLRPIGTFNYQTVRCSIHNPFILAMKPSPDDKGGRKKALQFRGQMVPVINSESCPILFIGSPRIETVEDLQLKGLYLTDLPVHDVTRDLILLSHHFKAEVNVAFQLEVTKRELEMEKKKVQEEKQRADALLHAMLPPSVTRELTSGVNKVVAEEIPMVTILFSDIRDFTTICHRCVPSSVGCSLPRVWGTRYPE
jgi:guanylate cyclase soluble subunit beta